MNRKTLGHTIKEIRVGKGLSQKYVVESTISQSNYSRFENGEIDVSASTFLSILRRLQVSLDEFLLFHKQDEVDLRDDIKKQFYELTYNKEGELENILYKIEIYDPDNKDIDIQFIKEICSSLLILLKESDLNKARVGLQKVWQLLSKRNQLFITDIYLLNSILFYFPLETVRTIKDFLDRNIEFYKGNREIELIQLNISINFVLLLIKEKNFRESLEYIDKSINMSKQHRDVLRIGICYIRKGIILSHITCDQEDCKSWINRGITLLEEIEVHSIIVVLKKEIRNYFKGSVSIN
ncbi:MAG: helix-turn-helix transcriptional regulator [Solibacillus sp.]